MKICSFRKLEDFKKIWGLSKLKRRILAAKLLSAGSSLFEEK